MTPAEESEIEEANARLTEGLKSCRSIVTNYREMIAREEIVPETAHADGAGADE